MVLNKKSIWTLAPPFSEISILYYVVIIIFFIIVKCKLYKHRKVQYHTTPSLLDTHQFLVSLPKCKQTTVGTQTMAPTTVKTWFFLAEYGFWERLGTQQHINTSLEPLLVVWPLLPRIWYHGGGGHMGGRFRRAMESAVPAQLSTFLDKECSIMFIMISFVIKTTWLVLEGTGTSTSMIGESEYRLKGTALRMPVPRSIEHPPSKVFI